MGNQCNSPQFNGRKTLNSQSFIRRVASFGGSSITFDAEGSPYRTGQAASLDEMDYQDLSATISSRVSRVFSEGAASPEKSEPSGFGINDDFALSSKRFRTKRSRSQIELGMA